VHATTSLRTSACGRAILTAAAVLAAILLISPAALAQGLTVGCLLNDDASFEGYTLFSPMSSRTAYLIDNGGFLVNSWFSAYRPGLSVYLLENGHLLRTGTVGNQYYAAGGAGGIVEEYTWEGDLVWEYVYSSVDQLQHHDIEPLPNGNVLIVAWEYKSLAEAIAAGRNPALITEGKLWPDHVIEVDPSGASGGTIVWEWHVWDHLIQDYDPGAANYGVIADHPELIDLNRVAGGPGAGRADWNHVNSVDYNPHFDQIILSSHAFDEIWVIDHSTTNEEAAGHTGGLSGKGGDLLYRWGNPEAYRLGNDEDKRFYSQHDAKWILEGYPGEGNILVFNNGTQRPGADYSSVDEIVPPIDTLGHYAFTPGAPFEPEDQRWMYTAADPPGFYAQNLSSAQRLPNGNTLMCDGSDAIFFEITAELDTVWIYVSPVLLGGVVNQGDPVPPGGRTVFRAERYAPDFAGFNGHDLTPGDPIEHYPLGIGEETVGTGAILHPNRPNPFHPETVIAYELPETATVRLTVLNVQGREVAALVDGSRGAGLHDVPWDGTDDFGNALASGVYFLRLEAGGEAETRTITLLKAESR
jgi:hypothetical protein